MKQLKTVLAVLLMATSFVSSAQHQQTIGNPPDNAKLIIVVNRANWCAVCKANGERFAALIMPYTAKGVHIYENDLTNDSTKAASKLVLEKANIYNAVITLPGKGMGKMLQSCGLAKHKKQLLLPAGIATFINPKTCKQVKQLSIASSDEEMKNTIETLLQ